ncbi:MAG: hypothetical protein ACRDGA_05040, partial [Bacteroidota bacterium]
MPDDGQTPTQDKPVTDVDGESLQTRVPEDVYKYIQELRNESADRRKELETYKELGDVETLSRAANLWGYTNTKDGLEFIQQEIAAELERTYGATPTQAKAVAEEVTTEKPGDGKETWSQESIEALISEKVQEPIQQLRAESFERDFTSAVLAKLDQLSLTDEQDRHDVLSYA